MKIKKKKMENTRQVHSVGKTSTKTVMKKKETPEGIDCVFEDGQEIDKNCCIWTESS